MKKLLCLITLLAAISSITSAQQIHSKVREIFSGEWQWVSYAGGAANVSTTDAPVNYKLQITRDPEAQTSLFYLCTFVKDGVYYGTKRLQVTDDPANAAFPYKLHYDVTAPLLNGAAMPSVNFRVVENKVIEFSNGAKTDFRYLFENVADGC